MADGTTIEWTHRPGTKGETWNPIRARHLATGKIGWHCETVSDGCKFCYAAAQNLNRRNLAFGTGLPYKPGHRRDIEIFLDERTLTAPLRWRNPRTIFVCSMTDAFGSFVDDAMLDRMFAVAALCPQHVFIFVTKRAARMRAYLGARNGMGNSALCRAINDIPAKLGNRRGALEMPLPNVWLIVSTEDQATFDERVADLWETPATVRGISAEPLLGPIWMGRHAGLLDWVIAGGESGPNARPVHPAWVRSLRDQCHNAGTAFFFKQWGAWWPQECNPLPQQRFAERLKIARIKPSVARPERGCWGADGLWHPGQIAGAPPAYTSWKIGKPAAGRMLDGREHDTFPEARR